MGTFILADYCVRHLLTTSTTSKCLNRVNSRIVCDLIEEKRPPGIFAAMNDACATAHADSIAADKSLMQRLGVCSSNPHFESRGQAFLVRHYAGLSLIC